MIMFFDVLVVLHLVSSSSSTISNRTGGERFFVHGIKSFHKILFLSCFFVFLEAVDYISILKTMEDML